MIFLNCDIIHGWTQRSMKIEGIWESSSAEKIFALIRDTEVMGAFYLFIAKFFAT